MKKTVNILVTAAIGIVLLFACGIGASAQKRGAAEELSFKFTVVDAAGNPVPQAEISLEEGLGRLTSDAEGRVSVTCKATDNISISKTGFKSVRIRASVLVDSDSVVLVPDILFAGESDELVLPYSSWKRRYSLGSTVTVAGEDLAKYSSADIRNSLTGILPGVEVRENYGQVGVSPLEHTGQYGASTAINVLSRGRQVMYMIDDVPVQINEVPLDPEQIESVTIIRDGLEKTMYGPTAAEGIISIKTKSGTYNDRYLNFNVESGVNVVDRMPEFVNAAQYAQLNNLARYNSGLEPLYYPEDVAAYRLGNPYDKLHPAVNFKDMILRKAMLYNHAGVSSGGGNDLVKYYAYLGYTGQGDIYKIGPVSDYNNVNLNGNLDVKLNRYIKAAFGIISSIGVRRSNNYGYSSNYGSMDASSNTTLSAIEFPSVLYHINTIPQNAFPIYADNSEELEFPYYGVSTLFTQNPVANILENGSYSETIRSAQFNLKLDMDMPFLLKGLKSSTYATYASTNLVRLGIAEDYAAYFITEGLDENGNPAIIPVQSSSHSVKSMSNKAKLLDYYSNRFYFVEKLDYEKTFGKHDLSFSADYMITKRSQKFITEHRREMNFGFNAAYVYDGKYLARLSLNEHGTYSLLNAWSFSPSLGFGWIISEEEFLKGVPAIDFLKFRVQASLLNFDSLTSANRDTDNFSWNSNGQRFGPYSNNQWFGSTTGSNVNRTYPSMLGNPNLRLEKRKELSGGVDMTAFGRRLDVSLSAYAFIQDGIITEMTNAIPLLAGSSTGSLFMNYNSNLRRGLEFSASWKDRAGDFSYSLGGWLATQGSKVLKVDELDYAEQYRSAVGKSATAIWGLKYIGQFTSDAETTAIPQLFDESLKAGDFKYQDMNGDGFVDSADECVIGDGMPKLLGALKLDFGWKGFDLSLTGTFRAFYDLPLTNSWFWNGWGDSNYSAYVLKNINNPAAPRLTYNKVNNNYQLSGRWLADGSFFKVQSLEIGYNFPLEGKTIGKSVRGIRLYARANNLLTLSGIEDVDPEALGSGLSNYPLMKTFVGGIKMTF